MIAFEIFTVFSMFVFAIVGITEVMAGDRMIGLILVLSSVVLLTCGEYY